MRRTAYDILALDADGLACLADFEIRSYRARLVELLALGFADICGLGIRAGIERLDGESTRREESYSSFCGLVAARDGDLFAALLVECGYTV
ncbi:hypothetical protein [Micromonospora sp. NPDC023956]|uniref:hypothetical protein n=1 Tax=Micromonospora sp. NPDC023956 TaxID=3155722 RepID=UPI0033CD06D2